MPPLTLQRRLPGVYFETAPRPGRDALPRMDVTAFVGFAASGPLDTPVPVEDAARFRDVFGGALPLAWNARRGAMDTSHLAVAVEGFFGNGGRRCWVVRVAREPETAAFDLPGLIDAVEGRPAAVSARSPGTWAEQLEVGTVLDAQALRSLPPRLAVDPDGGRLELTLAAAADPVRPGDFLRCAVPDGRTAFALAESVETAAAEGGTPAVRVMASVQRWAGPAPALDTPAAGTAVRRGSQPVHDHALGACRLERDGDAVELVLPVAGARALAAGDVVRVALAGGMTVWLRTGEARFQADGGAAAEEARVVVAGMLVPDAPDAAAIAAFMDAARDDVVVDRLRLSVLVWTDRRLDARVDGLLFADVPRAASRDAVLRSRYWALLPGDDDVFGFEGDAPRAPLPGTLAGELFDPRFPLAGPSPDRARRMLGLEPADAAPVYLPLGMPTAPVPAEARGPVAPPGRGATALERDGLAAFDHELFVDPALAGARLGMLRAEVFDRRYVQHARLRGLHALYPLDEVAVVGIPDAGQRGWRLEASESARFLEAPQALEAERLNAGVFVVRWEPGDGAASFELQQAGDPAFEPAATVYRGADPSARLYVDDPCAGAVFLRVRGVRSGLLSPWSGTVRVRTTLAPFQACPPDLLAPGWLPAAPDPGGPLAWSGVPGADGYALEESADAAFASARMVLRVAGGAAREHSAPRPSEGPRFYRVRAERGDEVGPWSAAVRIDAPARSDWVVTPDEVVAGSGPGERAELEDRHEQVRAERVAVHRALLRFCAARGDVTAVLTMPERYREAEVEAYLAGLRAPASASTARGVAALGQDEVRALSFASVYHPWLRVVAPSGARQVRATPPDGAVCGLMAAHAIARGAWMAPANTALRGVVGLALAFDRPAWHRLAVLQVNLLRAEGRGVRPLGADTLAVEPALRPLNARRLLILLRRLLQRQGDGFVFENNSPALRQAIYVHLTGMLDRLFLAGAFAGASAEEAFRVDVGPGFNPPEAIERGRLVVEVRVAPSRPMEFVTVRLVQRGERLLTVEA
jgi:hypothetical protein